jgi:hypothetical protein
MATTTEVIEAFVLQHGPCGELEGTSTPATVEGYRLLLTCPCGAQLDSWITTPEATVALMRLVSD